MFHELTPTELREIFFRAAYRSLKRPGICLSWYIAYPSRLEEARDFLCRVGMFNQYQEMDWGTEHPTWEERKVLLLKVGFNSVENHFVFGELQGPHYLDVARKT